MKQYEQEIPDIFLNIDNLSNIYDNNNSLNSQIDNINKLENPIQKKTNFLNSQIDSDFEYQFQTFKPDT